MAEVTSLKDAIATLVHDGDSVALEGFTHLIPFAAGHEIVRQGRRDLELIRMTPDLIYDQMIGMGCARRLVFSYAGNPGVGSLHRVRDAIEKGWPAPLELEEHTHAGMANRYAAGAARLPFAVLRGYSGTDLVPRTQRPADRLPVHRRGAQRRAGAAAGRRRSSTRSAPTAPGNVQLWGIVGIQKEAVLAADRSLVTVEEIVDELEPRPGRDRDPDVGDHRRGRGAARRAPVVRALLLRPRQRLLQGLGRDRARSRRASRRGWRSTSCGAQRRRDDDRGRGPRAARRRGVLRRHRAAEHGRQPRARPPRAGRRADLRVRHDRLQADAAAALDRRRRPGRDRRLGGAGAGDLQLLAAGRPDRRRLPRRRADRPPAATSTRR